MKSPTIFDQASITSVSCRRSRSPRRCISFGTISAGDCHRSLCAFLSGKPRHSAITVARRDGFIEYYLATDDTGGTQIFDAKKFRRARRSRPISSTIGITAAITFRIRLNTFAACGSVEYSAPSGTWRRCGGRSGCRVRPESRPSRDRLRARCHFRVSPSREWLL